MTRQTNWGKLNCYASTILIPLQEDPWLHLFLRENWEEVIVQIRWKNGVHGNSSYFRLIVAIIHKLNRKMSRSGWLQNRFNNQFQQFSTKFKFGYHNNESNKTNALKSILVLCDRYSHHEEVHEHFHDKLHQQIFPFFLIFRKHIVGEVCYPSHLRKLFEADTLHTWIDQYIRQESAKDIFIEKYNISQERKL